MTEVRTSVSDQPKPDEDDEPAEPTPPPPPPPPPPQPGKEARIVWAYTREFYNRHPVPGALVLRLRSFA
jgi:hypothetical protein